MKSFRQVKRIVGRARLQADPATDEHILRDAGAALAQTTDYRPQASAPGPMIWRTIMKSRFARYSVAATIVVAAALTLTDPLGFLGNSHGVVLGQVAEKVGRIQTVTVQEKRYFYEQGQDEPFLVADARKYVSTERGEVEEQYDLQGNLMYRAYMLKQERRFVLVAPPWKAYLDLPLDEAVIPLLESMTPKGMIDYFTSRDYRQLGHSQYDGHEVEGFEISPVTVLPVPPQYRFLLPFESVQLRLWVDVETSLPAGVEMEIASDRSVLTWFKRIRVLAQAYDLQWDTPIPDQTFDPNIPPDYKPLNLGAPAGQSTTN